MKTEERVKRTEIRTLVNVLITTTGDIVKSMTQLIIVRPIPVRIVVIARTLDQTFNVLVRMTTPEEDVRIRETRVIHLLARTMEYVNRVTSKVVSATTANVRQVSLETTVRVLITA